MLERLADRLLMAAATMLLLSLLASVVLGVLTRLVGQPLSWTDEMAQHLLVWTGFVGWIIAARRRSHIRITVLVDRLPARARLVAELAIQMSVILLAGAMLWHSAGLIIRNLDIEWVSLPLSSALLYAPMPVAAAALILQALVDMRAALAGAAPLKANPADARPL